MPMTDLDTPTLLPDTPHVLEHAIIENETIPDECIVFPHGSSASERQTRWLLVSEPGYVSLESMR